MAHGIENLDSDRALLTRTAAAIAIEMADIRAFHSGSITERLCGAPGLGAGSGLPITGPDWATIGAIICLPCGACGVCWGRVPGCPHDGGWKFWAHTAKAEKANAIMIPLIVWSPENRLLTACHPALPGHRRDGIGGGRIHAESSLD